MDQELQDPLWCNVCVCHSYWFFKLSSDQMAARPTKIMVQLGININCLLSYVATGASSRLFDGVKRIASKEGKGLLATKTTTEKKDKAKKAPSLAPPVLASR